MRKRNEPGRHQRTPPSHETITGAACGQRAAGRCVAAAPCDAHTAAGPAAAAAGCSPPLGGRRPGLRRKGRGAGARRAEAPRPRQAEPGRAKGGAGRLGSSRDGSGAEVAEKVWGVLAPAARTTAEAASAIALCWNQFAGFASARCEEQRKGRNGVGQFLRDIWLILSSKTSGLSPHLGIIASSRRGGADARGAARGDAAPR